MGGALGQDQVDDPGCGWVGCGRWAVQGPSMASPATGPCPLPEAWVGFMHTHEPALVALPQASVGLPLSLPRGGG